MLTYALMRIRGRMLTYADVYAVAHGGGGRAALHTGVRRLSLHSGSIKALSRYSGSIKALSRPHPALHAGIAGICFRY
jgi:hypothetical protein